MFKLEFINHKESSNNGIDKPNLRITIGKHIEYNHVDTSYWSIQDFEKHWREAIYRFLDEPKNKSCTLFVSMHPLSQPEIGEAWVLYRDDSDPRKIYVQNSLILLEEMTKYRSLDELLNRKDVRVIEADNGFKVSEWSTTLDSIANWANELEHI